MMRYLVAGCVLAALIIMGLLAFAQKHDEFCQHGRLMKTFEALRITQLFNVALAAPLLRGMPVPMGTYSAGGGPSLKLAVS